MAMVGGYWRRVRENTVGQLVHDSVFMRLWMVDEPGTEVIVGTAPA